MHHCCARDRLQLSLQGWGAGEPSGDSGTVQPYQDRRQPMKKEQSHIWGPASPIAQMPGQRLLCNALVLCSTACMQGMPGLAVSRLAAAASFSTAAASVGCAVDGTSRHVASAVQPSQWCNHLPWLSKPSSSAPPRQPFGPPSKRSQQPMPGQDLTPARAHPWLSYCNHTARWI